MSGPTPSKRNKLPAVSAAVDDLWPDDAAAAHTVLTTLREPLERTVPAGDGAVWERTILAALSDDVRT